MTDRRLYSVIINGETYISESDAYQFRVVFDIDIKPGETLAFGDFRIYNLAKTSTVDAGSSIEFRAGYTNQVDTIFKGYVTNTFRERDGASTVQRFLCKSGDPVRDRGSLNSSYSQGVQLLDVLKDIAKQWPRPLDIDESQFADIALTSGYMVDGDIPQELNQLAQAYNFDWVQDRGRLVITRRTAARTTAITEISQFTGMVGVPEVTRGPNGLGVYVINRLNPYFRINGRINIKSEFQSFNAGNLFVVGLAGDARATGEYNIFELRHRGDSHGNLWVTEIDGLRANSAPLPGAMSTGALAWGARVSQEFRVRVREIGTNLNIDPSWLMSVMGFETGYTFSPSIKNPGSSATGLIQFVSSTAKSMGTSTTQLARMTAVQQLDYVEKYFNQYKGKINNLGDCYMAVFWPVAIGKPDSYVIATSPSSVYNSNSGLDVNYDGKITRGEAVARVNDSLRRGQQYAK
jgi:hypothetical protein